MDNVARVLIFAGVAIALAGVVLWGAARLGLGRLPGDIVIAHDNLRIAFPIVTSIVVSIVLTVVLNIVMRIWR